MLGKLNNINKRCLVYNEDKWYGKKNYYKLLKIVINVFLLYDII